MARTTPSRETRLGYTLLRSALRERDETSIAAALRALEWAARREALRRGPRSLSPRASR